MLAVLLVFFNSFICKIFPSPGKGEANTKANKKDRNSQTFIGCIPRDNDMCAIWASWRALLRSGEIVQTVCKHFFCLMADNVLPAALTEWLRQVRKLLLTDRKGEGSCTVPDRRCRIIPEVVLVRRGVIGVLGIWRGRVGEGVGTREVSLQATWDRGGWILSQLGGFQVSGKRTKGEKGSKGNEQRGMGRARGMRHVYIICVNVHNECLYEWMIPVVR